MPKIKQEHQKCIGCGSCVALCPEYWQMAEDGKAKPIGAKLNGSNFELEIKKADYNQEAADTCPVNCIYVED